MARPKTARRPTKAMMLAVNAAIDGDHKGVDRLVAEHDLDTDELQRRLAARDGERYLIRTRKPGRAPGRRPARASRARLRTPELEVTINGRTSVRQLFRLIEQAERVRAQAQQELKRRSPEEIEPVKRALAEIELLRRQQDKLAEQIRAAEEAMG